MQLQNERWIGFPVARGRERLISAGLDDAKMTIIDSLNAQSALSRLDSGTR